VPVVLDRFSVHRGGLDLSGPFDLLAGVVGTVDISLKGCGFRLPPRSTWWLICSVEGCWGAISFLLDGNQHETNWTASQLSLPDCITHIYDVQSSQEVCTL
jgi:hypothetical protein